MNPAIVKVLEDLRQPLTGILGALDMIDAVGGDAGNGDIEIQSIHGDLETIRAQARRMKDDLQRLQEYGKISETQNDSGDKIAVDLGEELSEAADEVISEFLTKLSKEERQSVKGRQVIFTISVGDGIYSMDFSVRKE